MFTAALKMSAIKDMGNKESMLKQTQQNAGDMSLIRDGDVKPTPSVRGMYYNVL